MICATRGVTDRCRDAVHRAVEQCARSPLGHVRRPGEDGEWWQARMGKAPVRDVF